MAWQWFTDAKRRLVGKERRKDCAALLRPQDAVMEWSAEMLSALKDGVRRGAIREYE